MESHSEATKSWDDVQSIPPLPLRMAGKYLTALGKISDQDGFKWSNALYYMKAHNNQEATIIERYGKAIILKTHTLLGMPAYERHFKCRKKP